MKKLNLVYAFGLLAIASACAELSPEPNQSLPSSTKDMVFTLSLDNNDSKVSIADDGKTTWEINDEIYIHGEYMNRNGYCQTVVLDGTVNTISPDGKTATIHITTNDGTAENLIAGTVYPYHRSSDYLTTLYAIYPASAAATRDFHCYYYTEFIPSNEPIMVGCDNGSGAFVFENLCGVISFKISSSLDVDEYIFMGNKGETVSYSTYGMLYTMKSDGTIRHDPADGEIVSTSGAAKNVSGPVTNDGTTLHRICIPGGADFTKGFTILFKKSDAVVKILSTDSSISVPDNGYLPLGDVTSHVKDYVAPSSHTATSPALAGATELDDSALDKHANCYIVDGSDSGNNGKTFYFKAYQGNSTTGVGAISSVEVLWETYNDASSVSANSVIAAVDFDKQSANDYYDIVFQMPATLHAGNAVIAAKDVSDNILWSWHIWVPETAITTSTFGGISSRSMMDRNLGAIRAATAGTDDIQTMGLLYQWGRKDPFPNKKNHSSSSNDFTNHATTAPTSALSVVTAQFATVAEAIKSPTVFAASSADKTDWTAVSNNAFWTTTKTIYDPCPPGYKVPSSSECNMFTVDITNTTNYPGWAVDTGKCQFKLGSSTDNTVFPTGYLYYNGRWDEPHNKAVIWSATYESEYRAVNLYVKISDGSYSQYKRSRSVGGSVRCVAE